MVDRLPGSYRRERIGAKQHRATFNSHDGTEDSAGNPTLYESSDWDAVVTDWPCELKVTSGSEVLRGKQIVDGTTTVLFGEYYGAQAVTAEMQCVLNGVTYEVTWAGDVDGDSREMRIELKRENS